MRFHTLRRSKSFCWKAFECVLHKCVKMEQLPAFFSCELCRNFSALSPPHHPSMASHFFISAPPPPPPFCMCVSPSFPPSLPPFLALLFCCPVGAGGPQHFISWVKRKRHFTISKSIVPMGQRVDTCLCLPEGSCTHAADLLLNYQQVKMLPLLYLSGGMARPRPGR